MTMGVCCPECTRGTWALPAGIRARFGRLVGLIESQGLEPHAKHLEGRFGTCA
jgi:hypothetical protein